MPLDGTLPAGSRDVKDLIALRTLLGTPGAWTTGALARTRDGWDCGPLSSCAVSFCLAGAWIHNVSSMNHDNAQDAEVERLKDLLGFRSRPDLVTYNDAACDVVIVLRRIDDAIERATIAALSPELVPA